MPTQGGIYAWEFEKNKQEVRVRVDGQLVFNNLTLMRQAALAGFGLAYLAADDVSTIIREGRLEIVLDDWCPSYPGYRLYYPSRRQLAPAFVLLVEALRYRK